MVRRILSTGRLFRVFAATAALTSLRCLTFSGKVLAGKAKLIGKWGKSGIGELGGRVKGEAVRISVAYLSPLALFPLFFARATADVDGWVKMLS